MKSFSKDAKNTVKYGPFTSERLLAGLAPWRAWRYFNQHRANHQLFIACIWKTHFSNRMPGGFTSSWQGYCQLFQAFTWKYYLHPRVPDSFSDLHKATVTFGRPFLIRQLAKNL